ncbi:MAG: hypothetical protein A4E63_00385 [Syntrophorhabdus sp. PtaU1.Bin050]|jgi:hypothetical protein|nr:MAG: hypothetical protein A4E63_00385 [Syntrophorhabdus sp. PtaU1.Bin050]
MSLSTAIGMVSESLRNLLVAEMSLIPAVPVTILAPDEAGGDRRINLFLYKVQENATLRNLDWQVKRGEPNQLVPPPLSLNLSYLMTAYAPNDPQTGNSAAHSILGDAMRVFYENAIIPENHLVDGLIDAREHVKIMMNTLDLDELSKVWSTFTQPFRLSVLYEVSTVQLDMLSSSERVMAGRVRQIGKPRVEVPFKPPVVGAMEPASGAPGTVVTFRGTGLAGWKAYVTIMGRMIANGEDIDEDTFQVTLPNDLPAGFHEVRVDISHLFRRTFYFEVTL